MEVSAGVHLLGVIVRIFESGGVRAIIVYGSIRHPPTSDHCGVASL